MQQSSGTVETGKIETLLESVSVSRWRRYLTQEDYPRLAAGIALRKTDLDKRWAAAEAAEAKESGGFSASAKTRCQVLLDQAKAALARGDANLGWEFLGAFDREILIALTPEERKAHWVSAAAEASEKLHGWRKEAAVELRGGLEKDADPSLERLRETLFHLHEAASNKYRKLSRLRSQLGLTCFFVASVVIVILAINAWGCFAPLGPEFEEALPLAVLSGLLGGVLSVAYSVVRSDRSRKIPEVIASFVVTLGRPVIGAAIALPVAFFIESGLLEFSGERRIWTLLAFCFLGGFSERWFLGIVEKLESR